MPKESEITILRLTNIQSKKPKQWLQHTVTANNTLTDLINMALRSLFCFNYNMILCTRISATDGK